jgi:hypothetical protein
MRKYFFLIMSLTYWLFMVVGFADNWLYEIDQPSNSNPKFLIHAFFAFCWFSLLLTQSALIRNRRVAFHKKLGMTGLFIFPAMCVTTAYLYISRFLEIGYLAPLSIMVSSQFVLAIVLSSIAFYTRKRDLQSHKDYMILGSFFLIQPAVDRTIGHLLDPIYLEAWLSAYAIMFGLFFWYFKKFNWALTLGLLIWGLGVYYAKL